MQDIVTDEKIPITIKLKSNSSLGQSHGTVVKVEVQSLTDRLTISKAR